MVRTYYIDLDVSVRLSSVVNVCTYCVCSTNQ